MKNLIGITVVALVGLFLLTTASASVPEGIRADALEESQYAVLRDPLMDRTQVRPGEEFTLGLRLTPFKNNTLEYHIYGPVLGDEGFPTALKMEDTPGISWSEPVYPTPITHTDTIGTMYWFLGQTVVLVKGKVADDAPPGPLTIKGKVEFMSCTEDICLSPSDPAVEWQLEVVPKDYAGEIAVTPEADLLAPVETDWDRFSLPTHDEKLEEAAPAAGVAGEDSQPVDTAPPVDPNAPGIDMDQIQPQTSGGPQAMSIWKVLGLALLGGLLLNFMPCVLPVVSIKVISLARHAEHEPATLVKQGLVFCLGIMATFVALAAVVALIQAGGTKLGWGFQFQNPTFLIIMSAVIFAFGLSMAGVFTIKPPAALTEAGEALAEKEGYLGSFFKGVLATVLGTPCVGPFLGPALGYAFSQSAAAVFLIFGAVGVGMAIPYAAMVANPKFLHMGQRDRGRLTRNIMASKSWLVDFERVMAFVLFGTTLYLLNILQGSLGANGLFWTVTLLLVISFALWIWGRLVTMGRTAFAIGILLVPALLTAGAMITVPRALNPPSLMNGGSTLPWKAFSVQELKDQLNAGKTVLVDFTAEWCPNCKYNEKTALNVATTKALVSKLDVVCLKADWTSKSSEITDTLRLLGYSSIPLSVIFPAMDPNRPIVLDGVFTADHIQSELSRAAHITKQTAVASSQPQSRASRPAVIAAGFRADELEESEYAVLRDTFADHDKVKPGEKVVLALRLTPYKNSEYEFHLYGHEQADQGFPTSLMMDEKQAVKFGEPVYPKSEKHEDEVGVGYYLKGQSVILLDCVIPKDAKPGKLSITGKVQFMSCTDDICLSPSEVPVSWTLEVLPSDSAEKVSVLSRDDLLKPVETDWKRIMLPVHDETAGDSAG